MLPRWPVCDRPAHGSMTSRHRRKNIRRFSKGAPFSARLVRPPSTCTTWRAPPARTSMARGEGTRGARVCGATVFGDATMHTTASSTQGAPGHAARDPRWIHIVLWSLGVLPRGEGTARPGRGTPPGHPRRGAEHPVALADVGRGAHGGRTQGPAGARRDPPYQSFRPNPWALSSCSTSFISTCR